MLTLEALAPCYTIPELKAKSTLLFAATHTITLLRAEETFSEKTTSEDDFDLSWVETDSPKKTYKYWDKITDGVFLGKIPLINHDKEIHQGKIIVNQVKFEDPGRPLGLVVTLLDYFELAGVGLLDEPVSPLEWEKLGIQHHLLLMSDFGSSAAIELFIETIFRIKKTLDENKSVYIHCKAGVGRSPIIVLILLRIFGAKDFPPNSDLEFVLDFLKKKRLVNLNNKQLKKVDEVVEFYHKTKFQSDSPSDKNIYSANTQDLDSFLGSVSAKDAIRHLVSFKELALYASKKLKFFGKCKRSIHIQNLFHQIYNGKDANWYISLMQDEGPIKEFINAKPRFESAEDAKHRSFLAENFKEKVTALIMECLASKKDEIQSLTAPDLTSSSMNICPPKR